MSEEQVSNAVDEEFARQANLLDKNEDVVIASTIPQFDKVTVKVKIVSLWHGGEGGTDDGFAFLEPTEDTKGNKHAPGEMFTAPWPFSIRPSSDKRKKSCEIDIRTVQMILQHTGLTEEDISLAPLINMIPKLVGKELFLSLSTKKANKSREDGSPIIDQKVRYSAEKAAEKSDGKGESY